MAHISKIHKVQESMFFVAHLLSLLERAEGLSRASKPTDCKG